MTPEFNEVDLDGEIVFDRVLGERDLTVLQGLLSAVAPRWSRRLRLWRAPTDQRRIDVGQPDALSNAVLAAVKEEGATYRQLVEQYGRPEGERMVDTVELRGAGPELIVIVSVDQWVLSRLGSKKQLGNSITLQVRRSAVEKQAGRAWLAEVFTALCAKLSPAWGYAGHPAEYWAKVMSDPPRIEAIGRDFGRHLPGLFWLNYFGRRYRDFIGEDRLRSVPEGCATPVDCGTLISLADDPGTWDTAEYVIVEQRVRHHLGSELFFMKAEPDRWTTAPDFSE